MIHYINGKPVKNIKLNKPKRHALANYRHKQTMNTIKDIAIRLLIVTTTFTILAVIYLTNN